MSNTPLAVLDLVPISSGSTATQALRNSIDLAQQAERLGYSRYWFAEHHLNPGVAGTSPAVPAGAIALPGRDSCVAAHPPRFTFSTSRPCAFDTPSAPWRSSRSPRPSRRQLRRSARRRFRVPRARYDVISPWGP